jgi:hypothetical protein
LSLKLIQGEGPLRGCVQHVARGWHTQVESKYAPPKGVVGIVVAQKFPDEDLIRTKILEGVSRVHPDTVWVLRDTERKSHASRIVWETLRECGIQPFQAPLVSYWASTEKTRTHEFSVAHVDECEQDVLTFEEPYGKNFDFRATWRDTEMRSTCERIIVFHDATSGVTETWKNCQQYSTAKIYVVERGKKKTAKRKGRKQDGS